LLSLKLSGVTQNRSTVMKKIILSILLSGWCFTTHAQTNPLQYYYSQAHEAQQAGEYARFYEMISKAAEIHPYHPLIQYQRSIAAVLLEKNEEALDCLQQALLMNATFELELDEFKPLMPLLEFKKLKQLQQNSLQPILRSDTALVLTDRTLHPETITAGERDGVFYISSIHQRKVLRMDEKKNITEFTAEGQDGLTAVLGLKIDKKKNILWACSSPMPEMRNYDSTLQSAVFQYNLKTKKLIKKYNPEDTRKEYNFGDLILNKKGEVFISDSRNNIIFKVNTTSEKLETYFKHEEFWNIQGIAFSPDEKYLFISDYIKGLYRLTLATKELKQVITTEPVSLKSIDGLLWYEHSLIAIQNGIKPMRVTRYYLNGALDTIQQHEIIDRAHPAFNEPTNGCIVNNTLYYVANSQWSGYTEDHQLKPADQLQDIVILKCNFKPGR
jgi:sugar lactone lactonase YvrE